MDEAEATRKKKVEEARCRAGWRRGSTCSRRSKPRIPTSPAKRISPTYVTLTLNAVKTSAMAAELARKAIRKEQEKDEKFNKVLLEHSNKQPKGSK